MINIKKNSRFVVELPEELDNKLSSTKKRLMVSKSAIVRMALIDYCGKINGEN